jgi:hypothetical protein
MRLLMKQLHLFSILFTVVLLLMVPNIATASMSQEVIEVPYQINNSDRIVIGIVSDIEVRDYYTNNTITVDEWLYNPLPEKTIIVRTNTGTNVSQEDEAQFTQNESVLLMLNDQRPDKGVFRMSLGFAGKHPVSDRDAVIRELQAQGKWKGDGQAGNQTNETGIAESTRTVGKQEGNSNSTQKSNSTPFISSFWVLAIVLVAVKYVRKMK